METVLEHSQPAASGPQLGIDLGAIRSNYRLLKSRAAANECAAVVKADAYGLGANKVAGALQDEGCRIFFVAGAAEGTSLREALGPSAAIYVLNGILPGEEHTAAAANLVAVANSLQQLAAWRQTAKKLARKLPVAVQLDSGMSRLGLPPAETQILVGDPDLLDGLALTLVMSHLACADEPDNPANRLQRENFEMVRRGLPPAPASFANSSGIFLGPEFHFDVLRPGAALYGVNPTPGRPNPTRSVVTLQARVIQTRTVSAGTGIGYGQAVVANREMRLATLELGYADGWHRAAAASAFFQGARLPFIGRVSMDSTVIDISALRDNTLQPGDRVILLDGNQGVDDVAAAAGTIGYEVLTSLGSRCERIYFEG